MQTHALSLVSLVTSQSVRRFKPADGFVPSHASKHGQLMANWPSPAILESSSSQLLVAHSLRCRSPRQRAAAAATDPDMSSCEHSDGPDVPTRTSLYMPLLRYMQHGTLIVIPFLHRDTVIESFLRKYVRYTVQVRHSNYKIMAFNI